MRQVAGGGQGCPNSRRFRFGGAAAIGLLVGVAEQAIQSRRLLLIWVQGGAPYLTIVGPVVQSIRRQVLVQVVVKRKAMPLE